MLNVDGLKLKWHVKKKLINDNLIRSEGRIQIRNSLYSSILFKLVVDHHQDSDIHEHHPTLISTRPLYLQDVVVWCEEETYIP